MYKIWNNNQGYWIPPKYFEVLCEDRLLGEKYDRKIQEYTRWRKIASGLSPLRVICG